MSQREHLRRASSEPRAREARRSGEGRRPTPAGRPREAARLPPGEPPAPDPRGPDGRADPPRRGVRAAAQRSARRLLDEPLQRLRAQGAGPDPHRRLRARHDPAAHLGPLRRPAARDGEVARDALLPRQRALRRRRGAPAAAEAGGLRGVRRRRIGQARECHRAATAPKG